SKRDAPRSARPRRTRGPSSAPRPDREERHDRRLRTPAARRDPQRVRRLPAARTGDHQDPAGDHDPVQRHQPAHPLRRRRPREPADPRPGMGRELDRLRPAGPGDDPHGHRHHRRRGRVHPRPGLPLLPVHDRRRGRRRRRGHQDRQTLPHRRLVGTRPRPVRRPPHRRTHRTRRVRRLRGRGPRGGPAGGRRRPGGRGRQEGPVTIPDRQEHRPHRHAARRHPRSGGPRQRTGRHRDRHQPRPGPQQEGGRRVTPDDLFGYLIPSVVVGPLLAAALCLVVSRRPRAQNVITIATLTGMLVVSGVLLRLTDVHGMHTVQVGGWDAPVGITLVADRLSAMMLLVASIVLLSVIIYAVGQGVRDVSGDQPRSIFLATYLALAAGLAAAFIAGDLFNLFVGFEILLAASYVLLTLGASQERVRAGVSYTVVSMVSSMVFLLGIGLTYAAAGALNLS